MASWGDELLHHFGGRPKTPVEQVKVKTPTDVYSVYVSCLKITTL